MTTLILASLIILLICTSAGLIFLVTTVSDKDDGDQLFMKKKEDFQELDDEYGYEIKVSGSEELVAPKKKYNLSKKSQITQLSKTTRIVNNELIKDFKQVLSSMKQEPEVPVLNAERPELSQEEVQEFIDVLDIVNSAEPVFEENEEEEDCSDEPSGDEFFFGEQILKGETLMNN
ncbi:MAG: hypothetical protein LBS21_13105 [Clostridiales bacterium]|jgi:hypothetical protein|nr:hypothetical protein [Clostridiales bacterium]